MIAHKNTTQQATRPFEVWFFTICNGIFIGIGPVLGIFFASQVPTTELLTSETVVVSFSFIIFIAAFVAWKGHYYAGVALVALLAVRFVVIDIIPVINSFHEYSFGFPLPILIGLLIEFLWVVVNAWYFLPRRESAVLLGNTAELSVGIRALHALFGAFSGLVSFYPIVFAFFYISVFISDTFNGNTNADEFMIAIFYVIPALVISLIAGLIGGHIGYKNNKKYIGAIIGGLLGPTITLFPLSVSILSGWLR